MFVAIKYETNRVVTDIFFLFNLPNSEIKPQTAQTTRHNPTDPDLSKALVGETKIPDPII